MGQIGQRDDRTSKETDGQQTDKQRLLLLDFTYIKKQQSLSVCLFCLYVRKLSSWTPFMICLKFFGELGKTAGMFFVWCNNYTGFPTKYETWGLQRRLNVIYTVCLLIFIILCNLKLVFFFTKSLKTPEQDYFKGRRFNFTT